MFRPGGSHRVRLGRDRDRQLREMPERGEGGVTEGTRYGPGRRDPIWAQTNTCDRCHAKLVIERTPYEDVAAAIEAFHKRHRECKESIGAIPTGPPDGIP